jgi:uncharacterized UBP type Zn finger protein
MSDDHARKMPTGDLFRKQFWNRGRETGGCTHRGLIREVSPGTEGCQECLEIGDTWVHLRMCMTCGHVGCCNDSKNRHASKHFAVTDHPIVKPLEPGEDWLWCFADEITLPVR